jgi:hypothetical protein
LEAGEHGGEEDNSDQRTDNRMRVSL